MSSPRAALIADTAVALLAERGVRGLTHRAVDQAAGIPPGSTSNHARTRAALLETALDRLAELERGGFTAPPQSEHPRTLLAVILASGLHTALTDGRALTLARFELALEANRRPELRARYDTLGGGFRQTAAELLAAAGSSDPVGHAAHLVAWCDGLLFAAVAGSAPTRDPMAADVQEQVRLMLDALLGPAGSR